MTEVMEAPRNLRGLKEDDQVFVMNMTHKPDANDNPTQTWGDLVVSLNTEDGNIALSIPKSTNPIELTAQATVADLKKSPRLQSLFSNGMLKLVSAEEATKRLRSADGQKETRRLEAWRRGTEKDEQGNYVNNRLLQDRPNGEAPAPALRFNGNNMDMINVLIDGVRGGRIDDATAKKTVHGIAGLYSLEEIDRLLETNLPKVISAALMEVRSTRL